MSAPTYGVNLRVELPAQFLSDILTTAVEGGSNYWLRAVRVNRAGRDSDPSGLDYLSVIAIEGAHDLETDEPFGLENFTPAAQPADLKHIDIDLPMVARGIERFLTPDLTLPAHARPKVHDSVVLSILTKGEDGDYDAGDADVLVQLGLFGQVVFG